MRKLFILLGVVALAVAFTVPARAEVSFYGHILFETYIQDASEEYFHPAFKTSNFADDDLLWRMNDGDSRFGARFKSGDFGAWVELRPRYEGSATSSWPDGDINGERVWEASWMFGPGTLSIGHSWSPEFSCVTGAAFNPGILGGYGDPGCTVRADMVKLSFGALTVALIEPFTRAGVRGYTEDDVDTTLPKIAGSYVLNVGPAAIKLFGGYQSYESVDETTDPTKDCGEDIVSYVIGLNASAAFGPAYVKAMYWMGQNEYNYAPVPYPVGTAHGPYYDAATEDLTDADNSAYALVLGYNISETMKIEGGYEASKYECDEGPISEDTNSAWYITLPIKVAKNFTVTPEYIYMDEEDITDAAGAETDQGDKTYYGVAWKITF